MRARKARRTHDPHRTCCPRQARWPWRGRLTRDGAINQHRSDRCASCAVASDAGLDLVGNFIEGNGGGRDHELVLGGNRRLRAPQRERGSIWACAGSAQAALRTFRAVKIASLRESGFERLNAAALRIDQGFELREPILWMCSP